LEGLEDWVIYSRDLGWERKPGYKGNAEGGYREFDREGYLAVDSHKIADTRKKKIIFIGDSNTFGYRVQTRESFVQVVENLLPNVNAINLGVPGYSSYQGRVTVEKYVPILKPDLVIVSFKFNYRRYVLEPVKPDSAEQFEKFYQSSDGIARGVAESLEVS
jgi:hypothetical protein